MSVEIIKFYISKLSLLDTVSKSQIHQKRSGPYVFGHKYWTLHSSTTEYQLQENQCRLSTLIEVSEDSIIYVVAQVVKALNN